jgi:hypothetical protein
MVGRSITLLLIFVVTVVAVVVIFAYFSGVLHLGSVAGGTMTASGAFALSGTGANAGNLVVQVTDTGQLTITGVTLSCPVSKFASADCAGLQVTYDGFVVSASNPLGKGQTGSGSGPVSGASGTVFTPGMIISVTVTATFSDGSTLSQALALPAQAG